MSIIKDIFGKDNGITEDDLKNIIGRYQETSIIECKLVSDIVENGSAYHNVIKTAIGFLNKPENDSAGLLMIGLDAPKGVIKNIVPIKNNDFRQNTLRNKLTEDIKSIPSVNRTYTLDIIEVPLTTGYITLVEVHKTDPNAVFYSKSENTAYIRHSDTTIKWDLGDVFKTAVSKSYPIVYPKLFEKLKEHNGTTCTYQLNITLTNVGTSPGRDIIILLNFSTVYGKGDININYNKKEFIELPGNSTNSKRLERDVLQNYNSKPPYPHLDLNLGSFDISFDKNSILIIETVTYENRGITTKNFTINNNKLIEGDYNFMPYLQ